jgi:UDP-N-acetylglucosamine--N-acetylmuramyl-(pentapeptide) pyrophosphoryl-undecaprenol N-acetylglucosamine transferase
MAGGGTGGHVFPLVAVAHALRRLVPEIRPVFIGTARGMETRFVPEQGFELELLNVLPMRGGGIKGVIRGAARAATLLPEARALIRRYQPSGVFSIGGYAAGPVTLAARTLGLPVALMEPNSIIGLANLLSAPFVQRAYTAFEITESHFAPGIVLRSGVPLRPGFDQVPWQRHSGPLNVLVLGGSQGAQALNHMLPEALCQIQQALSITHQCGSAHLETVTQRYQGCRASRDRTLPSQNVEIVPFINDMPRAIAAADLVVGRAGAGAVSEIAAVGRPSLLIPYPHASGDHQRINAESLQRVGAARCIPETEATSERIARELMALTDRNLLQSMAQAAALVGRPQAADTVARDFLTLSGLFPAIRGAAPTGGEQSVMNSLSEVA